MHCSVTIAFLLGAKKMFPWHSSAMLALEANHVWRFVFRNWHSVEQKLIPKQSLMITEKIDAAVEASYSLLKNGDVSAVVARYREYVSANADRLSLR